MLDRLLDAIRRGGSGALVMRGEPGVGKTALLDHMVERASGMRVLRAAGVQSEMELAFAGLHQLCAPILESAGGLPDHQRDALRTAVGLSGGEAPNRFLVGLAVLGLFAEAARERPLVCVVDDGQWLDRASAQALGFAARRLGSESVAIVFGVREPDEAPELTGLPELTVAGLPDDEARALLGAALPGRVDEEVLDRIVAETRGNPLALLELPRGLTAAELAGGFGLPDAKDLTSRIEESYRQRLSMLPTETRRLLLVAAAEPLGEPMLVWRAAERLGIGVEAMTPATTAGLLQIGAQVRFRHPLVRSAVYRAASPEERRNAHHVLAAVTDPDADPDRRAWHAAQATSEPDDDVATELERSAARASARGGLAAAAAFLERSAELTEDPVRRAERALAAAQAKHQAGAPDAARRLLSLAMAGPLDKLQHALADQLRAQIAFAVRRGRDAPPLLLSAAKQLEPLDARLARETHLDALSAAWLAGTCVGEAAEAARAAPPAPGHPDATDLLLEGAATRFADGYAAGAPMLKQALRALRGPGLSGAVGLRWGWLACVTARDLWDDESWEVLATRYVGLARDAGALTVLPLALSLRIVVHSFLGELSAAASLTDEVEVISEATGNPVVPYGAVLLAAWQGREAEAVEVMTAATRQLEQRGEEVGLSITGWARALLANSLGRSQDALTAAEQAGDQPAGTDLAPPGVLVELVEAAARSGMRERATAALTRLSEATRASGTEWALGVEARSRALVSEDETAERLYAEAIDRLGRTRVRGELARTHLLYGEWLRRERRRHDAREQLGTAHEMFTAMGMEAFVERASRELQATGQRLSSRTAETSGEMTAQEAQIVRLVREGLSNSEVGARLFLSPRTVEWHLRRIFSKLQITSRKQLLR
ncbi:ATP-binding protein [Pseudonocardia sp. CA-142604]|uniref:ATP-binding protein n=1 Tax=Pseudonocardia sp. CA-142604 TaxID=3240024 RepID=UPI003D927D3F